MKATYERILTFRNVATDYKAKHHDLKSKFNYALEKMLSRTNASEKKAQEEVEDKRVELASEDDRKNIITGPSGEFKFTKENLKAFNVFIRDQFKKEFEVEPYMAKDIPELTFHEAEAFAGFVIAEEHQEPK